MSLVLQQLALSRPQKIRCSVPLPSLPALQPTVFFFLHNMRGRFATCAFKFKKAVLPEAGHCQCETQGPRSVAMRPQGSRWEGTYLRTDALETNLFPGTNKYESPLTDGKRRCFLKSVSALDEKNLKALCKWFSCLPRHPLLSSWFQAHANSMLRK